MGKKVGRKNKYDTHVKPYLNDIKKWYKTMTEEQVAQKLGISIATFWNYKREHEELQEVLFEAKKDFADDLKSSLKKRAMGYEYEEEKITIKDDNGKPVKVIERYKKYCHADIGAIHLLLKNLDKEWHNDDYKTLMLKQKQLELQERKIENDEW